MQELKQYLYFVQKCTKYYLEQLAFKKIFSIFNGRTQIKIAMLHNYLSSSLTAIKSIAEWFGVMTLYQTFQRL